mmetsp:Transcript_34164/g.76930  ORF Transcript_34164/g.76930 Transcript_34164/m.76930 type:complete len:84 (-) Transcript_34164:2576-2827(-)
MAQGYSKRLPRDELSVERLGRSRKQAHEGLCGGEACEGQALGGDPSDCSVATFIPFEIVKEDAKEEETCILETVRMAKTKGGL